VSAGQFTVPVTVLQRAQMTRIGAHHGRSPDRPAAPDRRVSARLSGPAWGAGRT